MLSPADPGGPPSAMAVITAWVKRLRGGAPAAPATPSTGCVLVGCEEAST
ncbi:hypothetical protein GTY57_28110 [Streptomyces sp. SID5475]|nr:hypothetical protein [Streptomyces sp. SID5475]